MSLTPSPIAAPAFQFPDPAVQKTVVNPITGSTYQWKEPPGKWVVTVKLRDVGDIVWEGDNPPDPIGDYKLWYSTDTLELYFYYCDVNGVCAWLPTSVPIQVLEDLNAFAAQAEIDIDQLQYKQTLLQNALDQIYLDQQQGSYVKKEGGDTMEGPLEITGGRNPDADGIVSTLEVLNVDSGENSDLQLKRNGSTGIYIGDGMNNYMGNIKFGTANAQLFGATGIEIGYFGADALYYKGVISDPKAVTNKEYVDAGDNELRQDIIELEEEIDAIAPSLEYGTWEWKNPTGDNATRPPENGTFFLIASGGVLTDKYEEATQIVISNYEYDNPNDNDPVDVHTWADADPGELIQLFDAADPDFLLGKIVQVHNDGADYVRIEFTLIQASGVPNDNLDPVSNKYLTRVNVFKEPSGGSASDFVLKTGDEMSGRLVFENDQNQIQTSAANVPSRISFKNEKTDGTEHTIHLWQAGSSNQLFTNGAFKSKENLYTSGYYYGWDGNTTTYQPRIRIQSTAMDLQYGSTTRISIGSADANYYGDHIFGYNNTRIYVRSSKGGGANSYGNSGQALLSNGNNPPYWGSVLTSQTQSDWNTTNSGYNSYIKNKPKVVTGSKSGIKITSSNGNYYIEG